jgi:hypothetical protein
MRLILTIAILLTLLATVKPVIGQQVKPLYTDPAQQKIDSLKKLFSGFEFAIQNNPVNTLLNRLHKNNTSARTQSACNYLCIPVIVLPVAGLELEGERINESWVRLKWKTYSETDNIGFDIERQFAGAPVFAKTGFVSGTGNSVTTRYYETMDANSFEGTSFYRLKQKDIDSNYRYSNIVAIKGTATKPGLEVFPNPGSNTGTVFQLTGFKNGEIVSITLTDVLGRIISRKESYPLLNSFTIPLQSLARLASGFYTVSINSNTKRVSGTFVIAE